MPRLAMGPTSPLSNKVPTVTVTFWIIKIMSTTVGETGADYLAVHAGLGVFLTDTITAGLLAVALVTQLRARQYIPWIYWTTVVLLSVVGTHLTDALTDGLGVSLYLSTTFFSVCLASVFYVWYRTERTLSIQSITTTRRELFYWSAVLVTFALGTAAGDLATEALGLGFSLGAVVFSILLLAMACAAQIGANRVTTFWLAYILTRPFGASLGDLLSQSRTYGGFGMGSISTSVFFLLVIVTLVGFISLSAMQSDRR